MAAKKKSKKSTAARRGKAAKRTPPAGSPKQAGSKQASLRSGNAATGDAFVLKGPAAADKKASALESAKDKRALEGDVDVKVKYEFRPADRGIADELPGKVAPDDVIELEFSDGTVTWMRADEYRERFARRTSRDAGDTDLQVPTTVEMPPTGQTTRGVTSLLLKSMKVLGVDVHETSALLIANKLESRKSLKRLRDKKDEAELGLFKCVLETNNFGLLKNDLPDTTKDKKPILVFLHGTLSSTWGSFGELWTTERTAELQKIRTAYGERVYGFEHGSLATSPLQNAIELAKELPVGSTVHLVSHSRGGLVGELLCRGQTRVADIRTKSKNSGGAEGWASTKAFTDDELSVFDTEGREADKTMLSELADVLAIREIRVARFVRVACPALGTTLASGRLDRWLSIFGTVAGKALPASPITDVFTGLGEFIAAVLKERTDPKVLPGVEAMMPESPFIRLINWPRTTVDGDLFVIAGDLDPSAMWARVLAWVSDRFFGGDHDLVVNTASMYGGANRTGTKQAGFYKDPGVNHFNYFRNADSSAALIGALTSGANTGLKDFQPEVVNIARDIETRDGAPRPVVIFLPGIMGSALSVNGDGIWMDISDLAFGGFAKLALGAKNVRPVEPLPRSYGKMLKFLTASHRVVPFPYDWRLDPPIEAKRLARLIDDELDVAEKNNQPVRILAHSMGGLVTRAMIANHPKTWARMCQHPGARFVMCGTPNGGSHSIPELLLGRSGTLNQLALLDLKNSAADLLNVVLPMPGVLAMLPHDPRDDFFATPTWAAYAPFLDKNWQKPVGNDLEVARTFRKLIDESPLDRDRMIYVAGRAPQTVCGVRIDAQNNDPKKRLTLEATNRGDGRVTWDSGIPTGIRTWYMDAIHGDLCSEEKHFPAIADLLTGGTTIRLPTDQPVQRGAAEVISVIEPADALYPDEASLQAAVLGGSARRGEAKAVATQVRVRVLHADLAYANFPVVVGHYTGDTIISAEKALDGSLGGQLSTRHRLGLYPGPLQTNALFVNDKLRSNDRALPRGAIVVGIGTPGLLATTPLVSTLTRALTEYVVAWTAQGLTSRGLPSGQLGVSALLIGSGMGGIEVADSVVALLRAVLGANEALVNAGHSTSIGALEIIELYRDRALETVDSFKKIAAAEYALAPHFNLDQRYYEAKGGRERPFYSERPGWWQRIHISGTVLGANQMELKFSASTRKARGSEQAVVLQRETIDEYIQQAIGSNDYNRGISRSLFELLLPNSFKDGSLAEDNLVLLVDRDSAPFPWELLEDPLSDGENSMPYVCNHGVLRQLIGPGSPTQASTSLDVLVVGDPISKFVELKGAQQEARAAAQAFEALGKYRVTLLDRPRAREVFSALFDRPYRVIHLAGHGVVNYQPDPSFAKMTGMVLGDRVFLTPNEIAQLRRVPELIFINCCHLGRGDPAAPEENLHRGYNYIAANLAQAFISKGARAVVAAGWAVGDDAATAFARKFYKLMLGGATFGESTRDARKHIYSNYPSDNTWGAYQCYGDPDYRLVMSPGSGVSNWQSYDSAESELHDIETQLQTADDATTERIIKRLDEIALDCEKPSGNGEVELALARAYWQALKYEPAVRFYQLALKQEPKALTLGDIEWFANGLARYAVDVARNIGGKQGREKAEELITQATGVLSWLTEQRPGSEKHRVDRLNLYGSIHKRSAMIKSSRYQAQKAVTAMREAYERALKSGSKNPDRANDDYYSLLNIIAGRIVESWYSNTTKKECAGLRASLSEAESRINSQEPVIPNFWVDTARVDCDVYRALIEGSFSARSPEMLARDYLNLRGRASRREFGSIHDQLEFLRLMAQMSRQGDILTGLTAMQVALKEE